jgi:hypothetical protein
VATIVSTLLALTIFPLASLGENGWKIAAALCARHIGGAVNFVAVAAVTGIDGVMVSAALAADNLICALYFTSLYALARNIPADGDGQADASSSAIQEVCYSPRSKKFKVVAPNSVASQRCAGP